MLFSSGRSVLDSNISIAFVINAIILAKIAKDHKLDRTLHDAYSFLFKNPKHGATESNGLHLFKKFVDTYSI